MEESNPFMDFLGRVPEVPIRAAKLPFQLLGEILGTPTARAQSLARSTQNDLSSQVTGEETPFSKGRQVANALSFGLIPGNPSASVDPNALNEEQSGRFGKLNALQQKLLTTRSPQDFADLIGDDSFFEERQPLTEAGKLESDVRQGNLSREQADLASARGIGQGQELVGPGGEVLAENEPDADPVDKLGLYKAGFTLESIDDYETGGRKAVDLVPDIGRIETAKKQIKFTDKNSLRNQYLGVMKPYEKLAGSFRGFVGSFGADAESLPGDIREVMDRANVDVTKLAPSAMRDVAMIFGFMKILDPESVVRESEQELVRAARGYGFDDRLIAKLIEGESLTDDQRVDVFRTMNDQFQAKFGGADIYRNAYLDIAQENGVENPDVEIPDFFKDVHEFIREGMGEGSGDADGGFTVPSIQEFDAAVFVFTQAGGDPDDEASLNRYLETFYGYQIPGS